MTHMVKSSNHDPIEPDQCARVLAALAAAERLKIVRFLRGGARNVTEIAEHLGTLPVNVAHHVAVLRAAGIVQTEKRGRFVYHSLVSGVVEPEGEHEFLNLGCCRLEIPIRPLE